MQVLDMIRKIVERNIQRKKKSQVENIQSMQGNEEQFVPVTPENYNLHA